MLENLSIKYAVKVAADVNHRLHHQNNPYTDTVLDYLIN